MALANLIVKIGADIAELKTGSDNAVRAMEKTSSKIDSIGSSIKSTLIGAFSVSAVIGFGKELLKMGDDIVRTADRTGLLTDEVQKLSFIAGQSGNSLEDITSAIGQLQNRLSSGDKSAVSAVQALGLSFEDLRKKRPFDQMAAIAEAVGKIPDPAKRAELAMDLFGRTGIALLPTLTAQFKELGDTAPIASEEVIRALDTAGDGFDQMQQTIKVWAANSFNLFSHFGDGLVLVIYPAIGKVIDALASLYSGILKIPGASRAFSGLQQTVDALRQSAQGFRDAATAQGLQMDRAAEAAQRAREAHNNYASAIQTLSNRTAAHASVAKAHVAVTKEVATVSAEAQHAIDLLAKVHEHQAAALQFESSQWKAWESTVSTALQNVQKNSTPLQLIGRDLSSIVPMIDASGQGNLAGAGSSAGKSWFDGFVGTLQSSNFGAALQHALGNASGLASALKGFASNVATDFVGTLLSAIPGIGPAISQLAGPLVSGFKNLWGHFFGTAGRDAVKDFANSLGGFDALHVKLNDLGADGERLWIQLTQGVGRNNPQQAQAAIDAITTALDKQKEKQDEVGEAAAMAAQSQSEAYQKAKDAIASLDGQIKTLSDSIAGEAPEEFMGIVEQQTRERIKAITDERNLAQTALDETARSAAEGAETTARIIQETLDAHDFVARVRFELGDVPSAPGSGERPEGYATGTRGAYLDFGAGTHVVLHGRERIVTEGEELGLDGGTVTLSAPDAMALLQGQIVRVARKDAAKGGVRTRAGRGRSY